MFRQKSGVFLGELPFNKRLVSRKIDSLLIIMQLNPFKHDYTYSMSVVIIGVFH